MIYTTRAATGKTVFMDQHLRRLFLHKRQIAEDLRLTDREYEVLNFIRANGRKATTPEVADEFKNSIHSASMGLSKLYKKGYLVRHEIVSLSGGRKFIYELEESL